MSGQGENMRTGEGGCGKKWSRVKIEEMGKEE